MFAVYTVEILLKDTPNKEHHTFNLPIKDKFSGPMTIQLPLKEDNIILRSTK